MSVPTDCPRRTCPGRDLGDEFLFFDRASDQVHLLNESARELLLLCDGTRDLRALGEALAAIYEIDPEQAMRDSEELLGVLESLGLVTYDLPAEAEE